MRQALCQRESVGAGEPVPGNRRFLPPSGMVGGMWRDMVGRLVACGLQEYGRQSTREDSMEQIQSTIAAVKMLRDLAYTTEAGPVQQVLFHAMLKLESDARRMMTGA